MTGSLSEHIYFRDSQVAFEDPIANGTLSLDPKSETYVGAYMHMGTRRQDAQDLFKHIYIREYLATRRLPPVDALADRAAT